MGDFFTQVGVPLLLLAGYVSALLLYRRRAQAKQEQAGQLMARDRRKPILYLRPFKADENEFRIEQGRGLNYARAEALLLEPFEILGPTVAIGRPEETMPPWGGAARLYAADDWKSTFQELLDQSQLAVLFAGNTTNLQWEVEQVFDHKPFVPTILLVPTTQPDWDSFRSSFTTITGIALPHASGGLRIVYFPTLEQPILFADTGDEKDRLLTVTNPYLGALTRVLDVIQPGTAAPWIKKAHDDKAAKIIGIVIGIIITLLLLLAKYLSSQ